MRIDLFLPTLAFGGAERVLVELARHWSDEGHRVRFVLVSARGELLEAARACAEVVDLDAGRVVRAVGPLAAHLRRDPPDALLASLTNANLAAVAAARRADFQGPVVLRQAGQILRSRPYQSLPRRLAIRLLARRLYPRASAIVCVSEGVREALERVVPAAAPRCRVVPNPVHAHRIEPRLDRPSPDSEGRPARVVSASRLDPVKRLDVLLRAVAAARRDRDVELHVLGDGPERQRLEALAGDLGVADAVTFHGYVTDPTPHVAAADVFASSSDYEGWPNALMESLACGTPVVATDCPSGPREILDGGRFGRLVPVGDAEGLAAAILATLDAPPDPARLRARAQEYGVPSVAARYMALLASHPVQP